MSVPADCSHYAPSGQHRWQRRQRDRRRRDYTFKPLFGDFVPGFSGAMTWTNKSYHSPRNSCVDYVEGDNCTKSC